MQKRIKSGVLVYSRMEVRMAGKDPNVSDNMLTPITAIVALLPQNLKLDFTEEAVLWSGKKKKRERERRPVVMAIHCKVP